MTKFISILFVYESAGRGGYIYIYMYSPGPCIYIFPDPRPGMVIEARSFKSKSPEDVVDEGVGHRRSKTPPF